MADELNIDDEIVIEDMTFDKTLQIYHYPCPCGDRFEIGIADLRDGEEIAVCPSCSLMIKVIFDLVSNLPYPRTRALAVTHTGDGGMFADTGWATPRRTSYPRTNLSRRLRRHRRLRCKLEYGKAPRDESFI